MKRALLALLAATLLLACDESNPLIGKWRSATKDNMGCAMLSPIEFSEKLVMTKSFSVPVTYSRDGARYIADTGTARGLADLRAFVFEKDGNHFRMISPFQCRMVKIVKVEAKMMTEGAECDGVLEVFGATEVANRIKKSMSASDRPLDDPVQEASLKLLKASEELMKEKPITDEQFEKAYTSGKASGAKVATYAEMKKRFDACEKTINELAALAGTD